MQMRMAVFLYIYPRVHKDKPLGITFLFCKKERMFVDKSLFCVQILSIDANILRKLIQNLPFLPLYPLL